MWQKRRNLPTFDGLEEESHALRFGKIRFRQCLLRVMNIKTTVFTSEHRLLSIDYLLRWPTTKKFIASTVDWSSISLPSARTDLETSTKQFQEKDMNFLTALYTAAIILLPNSIVRSCDNNVEMQKARSWVQRAHHAFGKHSSQHSAALERLRRTHAFVAETHVVVVNDDLQTQIYECRTAANWMSINEVCGRKSEPWAASMPVRLTNKKKRIDNIALMFLTGHLRRSMMMITTLQFHQTWTIRKTPVLSQLPSFELHCLHPKCRLLLALMAF